MPSECSLLRCYLFQRSINNLLDETESDYMSVDIQLSNSEAYGGEYRPLFGVFYGFVRLSSLCLQRNTVSCVGRMMMILNERVCMQESER